MLRTVLTRWALLACLAPLGSLSAQTLVHYWNFNDNTSQANILTPNASLVAGASIVPSAGAVINLSGTSNGYDNNLNARNGDPFGTHLRLDDAAGDTLWFFLPTTGFQNPVVAMSTRRSNSGAGDMVCSISDDGGATFTYFATINPISGNPTLQTLDFTGVAAAQNNQDFVLQIAYVQGAGGTAGTNRIDNLTLDADAYVPPTLVHYWNFNNNASLGALVTPSFSSVGGAAISHVAGGISAIDFANGTGQNFDVNNFNARNGDAAGTHLRFNDPIGGKLRFALPTTGHSDPKVRFATRRSGSGAGLQYWSYTLDGSTYVAFDTIAPNNGNPTLIELDFSGIAGADNNPDFGLEVSFTQGGGGTVGNNRFDNLTLDAVPSGMDLIAPVAVFSPLNVAVNQSVNTVPTVTFNEPIELAGGIAANNSNIDAAFELRLNNAMGAMVPFDATISGNIVSIAPNAPLMNSQTYWIGAVDGAITDLAGNALPNGTASTFTTIALQTVFQPGDIVPVAYRMNATSTEDEVALLTLVNILPGTLINMADAKYTDNAQPQCAGGLTWTAPMGGVPAGTVIYIQNDVPTASVGSISGAAFGLSSGGDQFIVYAGTPANPTHITALSSNAWVGANTSCSGSFSKIPATLADGVSAINLSMAPGNTGGNTVNAYYNGPQSGPNLKAQILDPANWVGVGSNTPPQTWPSYGFPGPVAVSNATVLNATQIRLEFNSDLDPATAQNTANYTGIAGIQSAVVTNNGAANDTVVLSYAPGFAQGSGNSLTVSGILSSSATPMFAPFVFNFTFSSTLTYANRFQTVSEGVGMAQLVFNLAFPAVGSFDLEVIPQSSANSSDHGFATQTITIPGNSNTVVVNIPIVDDNSVEDDEYLFFKVSNVVGYGLMGSAFYTLYIADNDRQAPAGAGNLTLEHVTSFDPSATGSSTEISAYDPTTQKLYATSAIQDRLDIIDFSNPAAPVTVGSVDMAPYGGITSVAVRDGRVAVASPNANEQMPGSVVFFDAHGVFQSQVTVGALPDMITYSPDGSFLMTANEGQPNDNWSVDPEGSVSFIEVVPNITQAQVTTVDFTSFNANEAALVAAGVRKASNIGTLSQNFEPEYIAISADGTTAWVTLQENNTIAVFDVATKTCTNLFPMGTKDMNAAGNGFDASDRSQAVLLAQWPIKSFYIPDAIATLEQGGVSYLITANEGDEREYAAINERTTVGASGTVLDPVVFPHAAVLKEEHNLGRFRISNLHGDTDNDGDYDELYSVGSRSFSVWNAQTGALVYDSGSEFEQITAADPVFGGLFNADNENNTFKSRSRAKGPEPEGVAVATINGKPCAFVCLERTGGLMAYNLDNPAAPEFEDYINTRDVNAYAGDNGAESVNVIPGDQSPDGLTYIVVANELSGTLSIFRVRTCLDSMVTTQAATLVGAKSARVNGFVAPGCGGGLIERGFVFGTNPMPTMADSVLMAGASYGAYDRNLGGLQPNTTYYFRAYAVTANGTAYGDVMSFTTLCSKPMVLNAVVVKPAECPSDMFQLLADYTGGSGSQSILWSTGATTKNILVAPGTYWVTVTDAQGCVVSDTLDVVANPAAAFATTLTSVQKNGPQVFVLNWMAATAPMGATVTGYVPAYRQRGSNAWTTAPSTTNLSASIDFTGLGLCIANYEFTVFVEVDQMGTTMTSAPACAIARGYNAGVVCKDLPEAAVLEADAIDAVSVYPNPTSGLVYVELPSGSQAVLLDLSGRILDRRTAAEGSISFDLSAYARGVYMIQAQVNGEQHTFRLIRE
ncbi:T9SS type A sorting domain-containing protein [bacterium]|nr:T9SS type A sorting domain-containing protein [bacterium]